MNVLLIFFFMIGGFNQKWYIPQGIDWGAGRILIEDTDRNGNYEFMFTTYGGPYAIYFYELHLPNTWEVDTIFYPYSPLLWDSDDFDGDGFYDLVMQCGNIDPFWVGITIFESPDSFSYPTQEVWRDTVGPPLVLPICVYDIDQDGIPEIVKNIASPYGDIGIYESVGDNQYDLIFADDPDTSGNEAPAATIAFGDFDIDGSIEFVPAGGNEPYWVYECIGNNTYEKIAEGQLPTSNIRDCFSVPDADSDGKPEFVVKGFTFPDGKFRVFIFEATGDNTYEIVDTLNFSGFGGSYYGGYSDVGDVDGDGLPEIALEGSFRVYMIEADSNDNFYVFDTLPGHGSGSSVAVYDIDGNGLSEVVISGNNETRIYEYVPPGVEEKQTFTKNHPEISISPNPFGDRVNIRYCTGQNVEGIELKIYNVSGRVVNEFLSFAPSSSVPTVVSWDCRDNTGEQIPIGVYFLKFKAGEYTSTKKIIKIR